jgi:Peptidase A4 family
VNITLRRGMSLLFVVALATLAVGSLALFPTFRARPGRRDIIIRERHGTQVTSSNWSGYTVTSAKGSVSNASGSWLVPTVNCTSTPNAYSATWVGIDGYSSNTVEQIGTESDCVNGQTSNYAWYEFYPHNYFTIEKFPLTASDRISADVTYAGGKFTVTMEDLNTGKEFSTSTKLNQADRSSAEWIVEAPYSGGVLPLSDFQTEPFGFDATNVANTCNATVESASGPIGSFNAADVFVITMTADNGATKAQPTALSTDKTSFADTWYSVGP